MHRSVRLVVLAALLLVLTACSGGDGDETANEPSASVGSSATTTSPTEPSSESASESASEPAGGEPSYSPTVPVDQQIADPCALLDEPDYAPLLAKKLRDHFAEQITQEDSFMTCRAYVAVITPLRFGFSLDPGAYDAAYAEQAPRADYGDTREDIDLGDRAFISERDGDGIAVYVEAAGVTFMIDHGVGSFGLSDVATGSAADVQAAAERMVENGAGKIATVAVLLPDNCPAPTDPIVTDLIGTVVWGRGGSNPDGISACGYTGADGRQLRASYTFLTPGYFDVEYGYDHMEGHVVVDPKPGVYEEWFRERGGSYTYLGMYPDYEPQLELELDYTGMPGSKARVTKKFLAWANAYLRTNEPRNQP